ncbi:hypothetical protein AB3S75_047288 [Citrus x aurantiifolia]
MYFITKIIASNGIQTKLFYSIELYLITWLLTIVFVFDITLFPANVTKSIQRSSALLGVFCQLKPSGDDRGGGR